ncbi:hypothetical protein AMECASPLE_006471 [Ameca splendens]|uniref:Uncharacterized protein n=1 Tax=Ameca splendens TaxID=208324 RepID=A0ABV0YBE8_9TELE
MSADSEMGTGKTFQGQLCTSVSMHVFVLHFVNQVMGMQCKKMLIYVGGEVLHTKILLISSNLCFRQILYSQSFSTASSVVGHGEAGALLQQSVGRRRGTPWTGRQSVVFLYN